MEECNCEEKSKTTLSMWVCPVHGINFGEEFAPVPLNINTHIPPDRNTVNN